MVHCSMKSLNRLQNHAFPLGLERKSGRFVDYYNHQRYHESLDNVAQADVWFGRVKQLPSRREQIKCQTRLEARRRQHVQSLMLTA